MGREKRLVDIEFLRAVAILYTLAAHLPVIMMGSQITAFEGHFYLGSGVDLFFVISGFVITRSFLAHFGGAVPHGNLLQIALPFWTRRLFRIFPAAWFWLGASLFAVAFLNRSGNFGVLRDVWGDARAGFLQFANLHMWQCYDLKTAVCANGGVPDGQYWTLSLEEQFYLLFPIVMVLTPRRALVWVLLGVAAVQILSAPTGFWLWFRSDGFVVGVLLGLASEHPFYSRLAPAFLADRRARWAAFVVLGFAIGWLPTSSIWLPHGMLTLACGLWVFIASFGKGYAIPTHALHSIWMWFGSRSYSLYLCHFCAYCAANEFLFRIGWLYYPSFENIRTLPGIPHTLFVAGCFLYVFTEATYRLIETPLRRRGYHVAALIEGHFADTTMGKLAPARRMG